MKMIVQKSLPWENDFIPEKAFLAYFLDSKKDL